MIQKTLSLPFSVAFNDLYIKLLKLYPEEFINGIYCRFQGDQIHFRIDTFSQGSIESRYMFPPEVMKDDRYLQRIIIRDVQEWFRDFVKYSPPGDKVLPANQAECVIQRIP